MDAAPDKVTKLKQFIKKISARRLVTFWRDRESLETKVIKSLSKAFSDFPQIGWVRANTAANEDMLNQVVSLRNQIDVLLGENDALKTQLVPLVPNLAPLTATYKIKFRFISTLPRAEAGFITRDADLSWDTIFATVGPAFFKPATDVVIHQRITSFLQERVPTGYNFVIHQSCSATIKVQLVALGFLGTYEAEQVGGGVTEFLRLTDLGRRMLIEIMAVRAPVSLPPEQTSAV